jgi:Bacterial membrane protein YfhO
MPRGHRREAGLGPPAVVAAVLVLNLWVLRATLEPVAYLDDASVHEQMVRYAVSSFKGGRNPLEGWFPYLGLGSPQFLHYQSLGAMVTGLFGLLVGGDNAFRGSLYLLLALWPLAIYLSARIFGLGAWAAAAASVVAPLLASAPSVGYENGAYLWIGYGLWAQLWGSWALPFAWSTTWRAIDDRRFVGWAAVCVAGTIALHLETGYLALAAVSLFPWLRRSRLRGRLLRAVAVMGLAFTLCAWVLVPLLAFDKWAAVNQVLRGTPLENGYGAGQVVGWLIRGQVFDNGRFPVVTIAAAVGVVVCLLSWRTSLAGRAIIVMGVFSAMLCLGRTTFGALVAVVPASTDLFFRRFMLGTQLAGIYLAGIGIVAASRLVMSFTTVATKRTIVALREPQVRTLAVGATACICAVAVYPAVAQADHYDERNASAVSSQHRLQQFDSGQIGPLVAYIKAHGGGRTYAGTPHNWGRDFDVGGVPVLKYLENVDIDEVGYTLRTASLMTDAEYYFDEDNPSDFALFGIRYLIYPTGAHPLVPARLTLVSGQYSLWVMDGNGYLDVVDTIGTLRENRADVSSVALPMLALPLIADHQDLSVSWDGRPVAPPTDPAAHLELAPPGSIVSQTADPAHGHFSGVVVLRRNSVMLLSASYDPGWKVTVDGRPATPEILAPAVVGVTVSQGRHQVVFQYVGYRHYGLLFLVAVIGLVMAGSSCLDFARPRNLRWNLRPRRGGLASLLRREHAEPSVHEALSSVQPYATILIPPSGQTCARRTPGSTARS